LRAEQVSEHGYETAHDILFPKKSKRIKRHRFNQGWDKEPQRAKS